MSRRICCIVLTILLLPALTVSGTTGKISGRVQDTETGEPLVGVSILIEGTTMGASTDVEGEYVIMNIPPGPYTVVASGVGIQKKRFSNVKVSVFNKVVKSSSVNPSGIPEKRLSSFMQTFPRFGQFLIQNLHPHRSWLAELLFKNKRSPHLLQ